MLSAMTLWFIMALFALTAFASEAKVSATFTGASVPTSELAKVFAWNVRASRGEFDSLSYAKYRREMTKFGLPGKRWHVGHITPNVKGTSRSGRGAGPEDFGHNLFAQSAVDNRKLGHQTVSMAELTYMGRVQRKTARGEKQSYKSTDKVTAKGLKKLGSSNVYAEDCCDPSPQTWDML